MLNRTDSKLNKWMNQKPNKDYSGCLLAAIILFLIIVGFVLLAVKANSDNSTLDWSKTRTHLDEAEKVLQSIDKGLHQVDMKIGKSNQYQYDFVKLHELRLNYLQSRMQILLHIHSIASPYDLYEGE